jgi:hypothetical protein
VVRTATGPIDGIFQECTTTAVLDGTTRNATKRKSGCAKKQRHYHLSILLPLLERANTFTRRDNKCFGLMVKKKYIVVRMGDPLFLENGLRFVFFCSPPVCFFYFCFFWKSLSWTLVVVDWQQAIA